MTLLRVDARRALAHTARDVDGQRRALNQHSIEDETSAVAISRARATIELDAERRIDRHRTARRHAGTRCAADIPKPRPAHSALGRQTWNPRCHPVTRHLFTHDALGRPLLG
ncbi:MAG TPA: hypothetical protein VMG12_41550 [Polyangiaceae bacterium]|nr:hypothetical protein [Polyangiaceae bacterium]